MKLNPCFILQVQQADQFSWSGGQHGSFRCGDQGTSHVIPTSIITPRMHSLTSYLMLCSTVVYLQLTKQSKQLLKDKFKVSHTLGLNFLSFRALPTIFCCPPFLSYSPPFVSSSFPPPLSPSSFSRGSTQSLRNFTRYSSTGPFPIPISGTGFVKTMLKWLRNSILSSTECESCS